MKLRETLTLLLVAVLSLHFSSEAKESASMHWNESRGYLPFKNSQREAIVISNQSDSLISDSFVLPEPITDFSLSFLSRNINGNPARRYPYFSKGRDLKIKNTVWGFYACNSADTLMVMIKNIDLPSGIESMPAVNIKAFGQTYDSEFNLTEGLNPFDGYNIWKISSSANTVTLSAGDHGLKEVAVLPFPDSSLTSFGFLAAPGTILEVKDINLYGTIKEITETGIRSTEELEEYLINSEDPLEGLWTIFDRELEESLVKLGGDYTLACVKEGDEYAFLYISGARINNSGWKPGDIKIILKESPFEGIYYVIWYDSGKEIMNNEIKAQCGEGGTLLIQFPYQSSKIRLRKITRES